MKESGVLAALFLVVSTGFVCAEAPKRASDLLTLPPAFRAFAGDPVIQIEPRDGLKSEGKLSGMNAFRPREGFTPRGGNGRLFLKVGEDEEVSEKAAEVLAKAFHRKVLSRESLNWHERRLRLDGLFISEKSDFIQLATRKLTAGEAPDPWLDAWWKVRMGLPQTPDPSHDLMVINLHYDHFGKKTTKGHFCFGLRSKGGDADGDLLFDFRAPWSLDRPPRATEGLNLHNRLLLSATVENLYDWLYTQTEYRHCYVECWFLPVSKEQVTLLHHIAERPVAHEAGQFRAFRKNCASLGLGFLHRLQPIGTPLPLGRGVADIPTVAARKIVEGMEEEPPYFLLENVTHQRGRQPTAKSTIHRAQPSRVSSRAFRLLRTVPEVN
ncbi:MAG: hypothetical protein P1U68_00385 [Verrucomicrobiales bacterium]|nr:hypothetical protein [Verrucomicrobiales bacterium]